MKLVLIGDVAYNEDRPLVDRLGSQWRSLFDQADVVVFNLEGPVCKESEGVAGKTALLRNRASVIEFFGSLPGTVIANLANNHIFDFGRAGFVETVELLAHYGIRAVGAGLCEQEAYRSLLLDVGGIRLGFLSFTSGAPHVGSTIATTTSYGCASLDGSERVIQSVEKLRSEVDHVIVSLHWGSELYRYPSPDQREVGRRLVDAGASIVVGHHPHVAQGIEEYRGGIIAYSLGNFWLSPFRFVSGRPKIQSRPEQETVVLQLRIEGSRGVSWDYLFATRDTLKSEASLSGILRKLLFSNRLRRLSRRFQADQASYSRFFKKYSKRRNKELLVISILHAIRKTKFGVPFSITDVQRQFLRLKKIFQ